MKVIGKRTETFHTIELSENQIISIVTALGLTTPSERRSEAVSFYNLENFKDDENLIDSLGDLIILNEKKYPKSPEKPYFSGSCPL